MFGEGFQNVQVVFRTKLVRNRQHQRIRQTDRLVGFQLLDQLVRLGRIGAPEGRTEAVDHAHAVMTLCGAAEIGAVLIVHDREDAAADRNARRAFVADFAIGVAEAQDLFGLQLVERHASVLGQQRRGHHVQPLTTRPFGGIARGRTPPDAVAQRIGTRLDRLRLAARHLAVTLGQTVAVDGAQEQVELFARDIRTTLVDRASIAESLIAANNRLGRAAADAERDAAVGQNIQRGSFFREIERVFIAHVDHAGADLDILGLGRNRRQKRHRRGLLLGEVMHAEIGAVHAKLVGADADFDRLFQHFAGVARLRAACVHIVAEAQKAECPHGIPPAARSGLAIGCREFSVRCINGKEVPSRT